jgi:putative transposase
MWRATKPEAFSSITTALTYSAAIGRSTTREHRYFNLFGLQPHRNETFKLSTDLMFIEKLHEDVGRCITTLFAELNVLDGSVLTLYKPCHRHQDFLIFLS